MYSQQEAASEQIVAASHMLMRATCDYNPRRIAEELKVYAPFAYPSVISLTAIRLADLLCINDSDFFEEAELREHDRLLASMLPIALTYIAPPGLSEVERLHVAPVARRVFAHLNSAPRFARLLRAAKTSSIGCFYGR